MGRRGSEGETERRLANGWEDVRKPGLAGIYHTLSTRQGWGVLGGQVCLPGAYEEEDMDPSGAHTPRREPRAVGLQLGIHQRRQGAQGPQCSARAPRLQAPGHQSSEGAQLPPPSFMFPWPPVHMPGSLAPTSMLGLSHCSAVISNLDSQEMSHRQTVGLAGQGEGTWSVT